MLGQHQRLQGAQYPMFVDGFELSSHIFILQAPIAALIHILRWEHCVVPTTEDIVQSIAIEYHFLGARVESAFTAVAR